jgi:carboxyl-terminal processing protease
MRRLAQVWTIALVTLGLFGTGCVTVRPVPVAMSREDRITHNAKVFTRAWDLVDRKFFDAKFRGIDWAAMKERYRPQAEQATDDDGLYSVINTMLAELKESHVAAVSAPDWFDERNKQRALVGIGFRLVEKSWVVTNIFPGSPAEAAGVQRGWLAVTRDGKPLGETGFRLKEGQTAEYEFLDVNDERHVRKMTARVISTEFTPEVRELKDAFYLRFDDFSLGSLRWLSAQLRAHRNTPAVVIDLRNNPGGYLFSLDFALGEFFPRSVPMGTRIRREGTKKDEEASQWFSAHYAGKVILLVGPGSASCSEIFAHVLQHHGRAVVVGQKDRRSSHSLPRILAARRRAPAGRRRRLRRSEWETARRGGGAAGRRGERDAGRFARGD